MLFPAPGRGRRKAPLRVNRVLAALGLAPSLRAPHPVPPPPAHLCPCCLPFPLDLEPVGVLRTVLQPRDATLN